MIDGGNINYTKFFITAPEFIILINNEIQIYTIKSQDHKI